MWEGEFSQIPLTQVGHEQAQALADQWDFTPSRIIVSPYLRTQQTAAPTIARFPQVPVETWDIHEFTFWDRNYWGQSSPEEAFEEVMRYWRVSDPNYRQGMNSKAGYSESFADLLARAETTLQRLEALPDGERVLLFTHGHFIQALRHVLLFPHWTAEQKMQNFRVYDEENRVKNTELITLQWKEGKWRL